MYTEKKLWKNSGVTFCFEKHCEGDYFSITQNNEMLNNFRTVIRL